MKLLEQLNILLLKNLHSLVWIFILCEEFDFLGWILNLNIWDYFVFLFLLFQEKFTLNVTAYAIIKNQHMVYDELSSQFTVPSKAANGERYFGQKITSSSSSEEYLNYEYW